MGAETVKSPIWSKFTSVVRRYVSSSCQTCCGMLLCLKKRGAVLAVAFMGQVVRRVVRVSHPEQNCGCEHQEIAEVMVDLWCLHHLFLPTCPHFFLHRCVEAVV